MPNRMILFISAPLSVFVRMYPMSDPQVAELYHSATLEGQRGKGAKGSRGRGKERRLPIPLPLRPFAPLPLQDLTLLLGVWYPRRPQIELREHYDITAIQTAACGSHGPYSHHMDFHHP